jgi:hypothetical protein
MKGLIFFHITEGEVDKFVEDSLNRHLKYSGNLRFILNERNNKIAVITYKAGMCKSGDSMLVNTSQNKISFFRGNKIVSESKVTESLHGRPF